MKRNKAFTLIELLVVISIIGLLSSVVMASLNSAREKGRMTAIRQFEAQAFRVAGEQAVGIWEFDECSGSVAADRSGLGNMGSLVGNTAFVSDSPISIGCSVIFDGTGDYINTSQVTPYNFGTSQDFTVMAWVKTSTSGYRNIVDKKGGSVGAYPSFMFRKNSGDKLNLLLRDDVGVDIGVAGTKSIAGGVWTHVAAVVDRGGMATLYVDGTPDGSQDISAMAGSVDSAHPIRIGSSNFGLESWSGGIDNVRIFSKTLTASEIGRIYASEKGIIRMVNDVR